MSTDSRIFNVQITTSTILKVIALLFLGYLLYRIKDLLFILLVAIVIASFVDAIARALKKYKIPRTVSVIMVFIIMLLALAAIIYAIIPTLFNELTNALKALSQIIPEDKLPAIIDPNIISNIDAFINNIGTDASSAEVATNTGNIISGISGAFFATIQTFFGSLANLVLIFVLSFYLSIQEKGIEGFLRLIMPIKYEEYVIGLWNRSSRKIALWIRGQMMLALSIAIVTFIVLSVLDIPYALILSLLTLVCEMIPFGMIFATIPSVLVALSFGGLQLGLIVLLFYFLLQQLEGYVLVPLINRSITGISPLMVILSILIGARLAGFWGLILAMPVALFLLELMNDVETKKDSLRKLSSETI